MCNCIILQSYNRNNHYKLGYKASYKIKIYTTSYKLGYKPSYKLVMKYNYTRINGGNNKKKQDQGD